ncbi:MAG: hypothetical protein GY830_07215 [Bacteroidetes bacterium]|nr:hypothetical protein [Bacteroidota bacterium]
MHLKVFDNQGVKINYQIIFNSDEYIILLILKIKVIFMINSICTVTK